MLVAAGALKASNLTIEITPTRNHLRPTLSFKERLIMSVIRFKRDITHDTRNALLVIVVLIATVSCQGSLTPPGGVWQDSNSSTTQVHHAGKVIMSNISFLFFWFLNSITLWTTELAFFFLVDGRFSKLLFIPVYLFTQCYTLPLSMVSPSPTISIVIIITSVALPLVMFMLGYWFLHRAAKKLKIDALSVRNQPTWENKLVLFFFWATNYCNLIQLLLIICLKSHLNRNTAQNDIDGYTADSLNKSTNCYCSLHQVFDVASVLFSQHATDFFLYSKSQMFYHCSQFLLQLATGYIQSIFSFLKYCCIFVLVFSSLWFILPFYL